MYYGKINKTDIVNGTGVRVSLFVSGCRRKCPGCFNLEAQDFNYGKEFTNDTVQEIMGYLDNPWTRGLTILGGEPLEPENLSEVARLVMTTRQKFGIGKTIWIYSGFCWEDLMERSINDLTLAYILHSIDVLVDGPFIEYYKDITLRFKGSSNQRIIDVAKSIETGAVMLAEV